VVAMSQVTKKYLKFGAAISVIVLTLAYLAFLGAQESKSYYVTIKELHGMGDVAYTRNLRVAGNVQPGSIKMNGPQADFILVENNEELKVHETLHVIYKGSEPPPDTFKDNAQALAIGGFKRDGVFYANELQAKCASKYAPQQQQPGAAPAAQPVQPQSKGY
jgi:cytochrome c-type biogenesis protein CcmE